MRIALGIEYDGHGFSGWQRQLGVETIQELVEKALSKVANHPVTIICAGRTDAGVHATEQIVHFESDAIRSHYAWVNGCNANLPSQIAVLWATEVSSEFHARFSAYRRRYRYIIYNRRIRPTFLATRTSWIYRPLDVSRMAAAAQHLIGEHDFNAYRAVGCQAKSPVRTLYDLDITRRDEMIFIDIRANAFLHHMVRNIAGVLVAIGGAERPIEWAREVLEQRDRTQGGITASPCGLYLMEVEYPEAFVLPKEQRSSAVW